MWAGDEEGLGWNANLDVNPIQRSPLSNTVTRDPSRTCPFFGSRPNAPMWAGACQQHPC